METPGSYTEMVVKEYDVTIARFEEGSCDRLILHCEGKMDAVIVANECRYRGFRAEIQELDDSEFGIFTVEVNRI